MGMVLGLLEGASLAAGPVGLRFPQTFSAGLGSVSVWATLAVAGVFTVDAFLHEPDAKVRGPQKDATSSRAPGV